MADAWARLTRGVGVAIVTAGPGVSDIVTAVANAYYAQVPLVVIGGAGPFFLMERGSLQDMDHVSVMKPITKWAKSCHETRRIPEYLTTAFRIARSGVPGPCFLELPVDVLMNFIEEENVDWPRDYLTRARPFGDPEYVDRAVETLHKAEKCAIMAGSQIWWDDAAAELVACAEALELPVYTNAMGRGTIPPTHRLAFQLSRRQALSQADWVLVVGTPFDFRLNYGQSPTFGPQTKVIQVDRDAHILGKNRACEIGIHADAKAVLAEMALKARAVGKPDRAAWLGMLRDAETKSQERQREKEKNDAVPISHYRFAREIADFIKDDPNTLLIGDGGDIVVASAKVLPQRKPGGWLDPGPLGCLGVGVPFAIAARKLDPKRRILLISGDGAFGLNGFDVETALRHNLPFVIVLGNDGAWGQIRGPQIAFYTEERAVATKLAMTRYDKIVEAMGGHGEHVTKPGDMRGALERAFASGKVALVNVEIDPTTMREEAMAKGLTI
jgi:acetolactate synthase-1/2/3 large subunit